MVNDILKEFYFDLVKRDKYTLGKVTSISDNHIYSVSSFTTGLNIKIKDKFNDYNVGDRVVVSDFGSLNGAFIVKKVSFLFPAITNTSISNGEG